MPVRALVDRVPVNYEVVGRREWLQTIDCPSVHKREVVFVGDFSPWIDWLRGLPILSVDSETGGDCDSDALDPTSDTSRMIFWQAGNEERQIIGEPDLFVPAMKDILESDRQLKIGVHLVFDYEWVLAKYGVKILNMHCCMLAEQILTAGLQGMQASMRAMARRYHPHLIIAKEIRSIFPTLRRGDVIPQEAVEYSAADVVIPFPIYRAQLALLQQRGLVNVSQLEFNCLHVTAEMELEGVLIDVEKLDLQILHYNRELKRVSRDIQALYEDISGKAKTLLFPIEELGEMEWVSLSSNPKKLAALKEIGIEVGSMEREVIETLANDIHLDPKLRKLCSLLVELSGIAKNVSTYGPKFKGRIRPDGRIHAKYHQLGSGIEDKDTSTISTGRFSGDFQQIPRPREILSKATPEELATLMHLFPQAFPPAL